MTRDDMVQQFTDMIDDAFEAGWNRIPPWSRRSGGVW